MAKFTDVIYGCPLKRLTFDFVARLHCTVSEILPSTRSRMLEALVVVVKLTPSQGRVVEGDHYCVYDVTFCSQLCVWEIRGFS